MPCKSCGSDKLSKFTGELALHFLGLKDLQKPIVWIFPEVSVCLNCGTGEFVVPERELRELAKGQSAEAG
jgi:hypothetical protein